MFPILCLRQALGVMLSPKVSCGILELTWTSMCITWLQFGGHTQHGQFSPACAPIGPKTAQRAQVGPVWGQPGAKLGFLPLFPTFFGFGVRARPCCPHWACLGPNFGARCPHRTKLRVLSPTCAQTCPSCAMLGPSWAQVGPKFGARLRTSWAQVGNCSAQLKAKVQVWPQSALGWGKWAHFFPLRPIPRVRAVLVAKWLE